jgi:hypothetical protein
VDRDSSVAADDPPGQRGDNLMAHAHDRHPNDRGTGLIAEWRAYVPAPGIEADPSR